MQNNPSEIELAEKIVDLTGLGQALHINDILPDIKEFAFKERAEGESEGRKEMYKQLKPFLDPFATLPTDSTEGITNKD